MEDPVYLNDEHVLSRMLASETRQQMDNYFESGLQTDFNENDRRELAIWMRDVCIAEECQPDVFPLSMLIVDRFLSFVRTKRQSLQILGSVALLLASKLRQTTQISTKHLIYYTQSDYPLREMLLWEFLVLRTLKWDVAFITPVDYLDIFTRRLKLTDELMISDIEEEAQNMIVECCFEFKHSLYTPSLIAWFCLMSAMDKWQLSAEHLHLSTRVVAREANNFMLTFSSPKSAPKFDKHRRHHPYHNPDHRRHHNHHHRRQSSGLNSDGDSCASDTHVGSPVDYRPRIASEPSEQSKLQANLVALDWIQLPGGLDRCLD